MGVLDALAFSLATQRAKKVYFEASATNAQCLRQDPIILRRSLSAFLHILLGDSFLSDC